jgi:hypothetical protein
LRGPSTSSLAKTPTAGAAFFNHLLESIVILIGNNKLDLNGATLCAIVEKHLNDSLGYSLRATQEIKVSGVKTNNTEGIYSFNVTVEEKKPVEKAA